MRDIQFHLFETDFDAHKQYYKTSDNDTHFKSPMSNNNLEENVVYANRITRDGHEYLAKFDAERVKNMISGHHAKPQWPVDSDEDGHPRRQLNENERSIVGDDERYELCRAY